MFDLPATNNVLNIDPTDLDNVGHADGHITIVTAQGPVIRFLESLIEPLNAAIAFAKMEMDREAELRKFTSDRRLRLAYGADEPRPS